MTGGRPSAVGSALASALVDHPTHLAGRSLDRAARNDLDGDRDPDVVLDPIGEVATSGSHQLREHPIGQLARPLATPQTSRRGGFKLMLWVEPATSIVAMV
jgi:hypothetical protein